VLDDDDDSGDDPPSSLFDVITVDGENLRMILFPR
jgi:hypothetical protein